MGVHVSPILNPPPTSLAIPHSGSSQCTSPEHPVSCIEPGLDIYFTYDNIHVSMLYSQIIPPSPSPTEFESLSFTSVPLCCLTYRVIITIYLNSIWASLGVQKLKRLPPMWETWVRSLGREDPLQNPVDGGAW